MLPCSCTGCRHRRSAAPSHRPLLVPAPSSPLQPAVQTLGAVQSAGVQTVATDVCTQLASLVTGALANGDAASAARIVSVTFVQGALPVVGGGGLGPACPAPRPSGSSPDSLLLLSVAHPPSLPSTNQAGSCDDAIADALNAANLGCAKLVPLLATAYTLAKAAGGPGGRGRGWREWALGSWPRVIWALVPPCLPPMRLALPSPSRPAGAEAAFVSTLASHPVLLAKLNSCLTPEQTLYGATLQSVPESPAAQVVVQR